MVRASGLDVSGRRRRPEAGAEGGEEGGLGHGGGRWGERAEGGSGTAKMERDLEERAKGGVLLSRFGPCVDARFRVKDLSTVFSPRGRTTRMMKPPKIQNLQGLHFRT